MLTYMIYLVTTASQAPDGGGSTIKLPDVSNSPILVWTAIVVGAIVIIATAVPRVLGPLGTAIADWSDKRRRAGAESDDYELTDLRRQLKYMKTELESERAYTDKTRDMALEHTAWDHKAITSLRENVDEQFPAAPPILPLRVVSRDDS